MGRYTIFIVLFMFNIAHGHSNSKQGIEMRVTDKGLQYAMEVAITTFEKEMVGKPLSMKKGEQGSLSFDVRRALIEQAKINKYSLSNVKDVGLRAYVADIYILVKADLSFVYKKWFITIRDSLTVTATTEDASFDIGVNIGYRPDGRPSMRATNCKADVGKLALKFSNSNRSWLYNILERIFRSTIADKVNDLLCEMAVKEMREKGDNELASFPVIRRIDKYASIDYRLTEAPKFTADYMDVYLKGEIFSRRSRRRSSLPIPSFNVSSEASKMVYFWITDRTFNTAGEVYHNSGALQYTVTISDTQLPSLLRRKLTSTAEFASYIPQISSLFPDLSLQIFIKSSKAPAVMMTTGKLKLMAFSEVTFRTVMGNGTFELFTLALDVDILGNVKVMNDFITGNVSDFEYTVRLVKSNIGKFEVSVLENRFVRELIETGILNQIRPAIHKGFPMPTIEDIRFVNSNIELKKNVLVIGSDCKFVA